MSSAVSIVTVVPISEISAMSDDQKKECFSDKELIELQELHVQTSAGYLAVKRGLVELFGKKGIDTKVKEFALCHIPDGKPVVDKGPAGLIVECIKISISHTKTHAYGLVSIQDDDL